MWFALMFLVEVIAQAPSCPCPCPATVVACPAQCASCISNRTSSCVCETGCGIRHSCATGATFQRASSTGCFWGLSAAVCQQPCFTPTTQCATCREGRFGPNCEGKCPGFPENCNLHGQCRTGIHGDGTCDCAVGYTGADCGICRHSLIYGLCISVWTIGAIACICTTAVVVMVVKCAPLAHWLQPARPVPESVPLMAVNKYWRAFPLKSPETSVASMYKSFSFPTLQYARTRPSPLDLGQKLGEGQPRLGQGRDGSQRSRNKPVAQAAAEEKEEMVFGETVRLDQIFFSAATIPGIFSQGPWANKPLSAWVWKEDSWPMGVFWHNNRWHSVNNRTLFCLKKSFPADMDILVDRVPFSTEKFQTRSEGTTIEVLDGEFKGVYKFDRVASPGSARTRAERRASGSSTRSLDSTLSVETV